MARFLLTCSVLMKCEVFLSPCATRHLGGFAGFITVTLSPAAIAPIDPLLLPTYLKLLLASNSEHAYIYKNQLS